MARISYESILLLRSKQIEGHLRTNEEGRPKKGLRLKTASGREVAEPELPPRVTCAPVLL